MIATPEGFKSLIYEIKFIVAQPAQSGAAPVTPTNKSLFPAEWLGDPSIADRPGRKSSVPEQAIIIPMKMTGVARHFRLLTSLTGGAPGEVFNPAMEEDRASFAKMCKVVGDPWIAQVDDVGESILTMIAHWPDPEVERSTISRFIHFANGGC